MTDKQYQERPVVKGISGLLMKGTVKVSTVARLQGPHRVTGASGGLWMLDCHLMSSTLILIVKPDGTELA